MPYVILGILVVVTVLNVLFQIRVRRRKHAAAEEYERLMSEVRARSQESIDRESLRIDRSYPVVSDTDVGYLIGVDSQKGVGFFTDPATVRIFRTADIVSSSVQIVPLPDDPSSYAEIRVVMTLAGDEPPMIVIMGDRPRKRSSIIGRFIQDHAKQLDTFIKSLIQPSV